MGFFPGLKATCIWAVVALGSCLPADSAETVLGTHILLQVDREDVVDTGLTRIRDEMRVLLRDARIAYADLAVDGDAVQLRVRSTSDIEAARAALQPLLRPASAGAAPGIALDEPEPGLLRLRLTETGVGQVLDTAATKSVQVIKQRLQGLDLKDPLVERKNADSILVQVPGLQDSARLRQILVRKGWLTLQFVDESMPVEEALAGEPPSGSVVLYSEDNLPFLVQKKVVLTGESITDAKAGTDQYSNAPVVTFSFDTDGKAKFGEATQANVGRQLAIVVDEKVVSAPVIREPILGGTGQISDNFTPESAQDLALMLRTGPLPVDLTIIEERANQPIERLGVQN